MAYFQEQLASLSRPATEAQSRSQDDLQLDHETTGMSPGAAQMGGIILALSLGAWTLSQTGNPGPIGSASNSLASMAAHTIPHLMAAGLAHAEAEITEQHSTHSERRRTERRPENEVDDGILSAQMFLAAGELLSALEVMQSTAELIAVSADDEADEQFSIFCDTANDLLSAVCESAVTSPSKLDPRILDLALELADITGASHYVERLAALRRGEAITSAA